MEGLEKLQEFEQLHLGNKIRNAHLYFQQMKVKLAVQLLCKSVADALAFCREELKLKQFQNSEATVELIRIFNYVFDLYLIHAP